MRDFLIIFLLLIIIQEGFAQKGLIKKPWFDDDKETNDSIPSFHFTDVTGAPFEQYYEAYAVFTNVDSSFYVTAGSDSFKIGVLSSYDVGTVQAGPGDTVYVPKSASAICSTTVSTTVTAGGRADIYSVTTTTDNIPDAFAFTDVNNAELSTVYGDTMVVAGLDCNAVISISPQVVTTVFKIHYNGIWRDSNNPATVIHGDTVFIRVASSGNYSTVIGGTLTIGGISDIFSITTKAEPAASDLDYMVTSDGDTMYTSESDTMKTAYLYNFNKYFNNGDQNETDTINNGSVLAILSKRTGTMELRV